MKKKYVPRLDVNPLLARVLIGCALGILGFLIFGSVSAYQFTTNACGYYQTSTPEAPCGSDWSLLTRALYIGFARFGWAVALAVLTVLCAFNRGEFVQGFLSHPGEGGNSVFVGD